MTGDNESLRRAALRAFLRCAQLVEAHASVALDSDSRYCTVAGRECHACHRVYNMDHERCHWCGAKKGEEG